MKRAIRPFTLAVVLLFAPACFAWGADGHKIVAEIAWREMTPETRAAVEALLADDPEDKTLIAASTWADRIQRFGVPPPLAQGGCVSPEATE